MDYIVLAIPVFLALVALELVWDRYRGTGYYRFNDALNSLNVGMLSRISALVVAAVPLSIYAILFHQWALWNLGTEALWVWILAFVIYDLCYYWAHRLGHEVSVLWAAHVVHHQSEEYNLTTALRQTSTGAFLGWVFYLPMALLGIDPLIAATVGSLNLLYQFWVHTRHIDQMPSWYEAVFVTPSNHRVHHAQNQSYIDRNYGGVFILWDRLFGTYQPELADEPCIFGVRKPLTNWNPVWANLDVYASLWKDACRARRWQDKLGIWFRRTGWRPADVAAQYPRPRADLSQFKKFDTGLTRVARVYLFSQFVVFIILTFGYLNLAEDIGWQGRVIALAVALYSLFSFAMVQHGHRRAIITECLRLMLLAAVFAMLMDGVWAVFGAGVYVAISLGLLFKVWRQFDAAHLQKTPVPTSASTQ